MLFRSLKANFPNARILDIDREDNMTEVEILDGKVVRELLFDGTGNWLFTKTEMSYAALPAVVKQALDASEYAGYWRKHNQESGNAWLRGGGHDKPDGPHGTSFSKGYADRGCPGG